MKRLWVLLLVMLMAMPAASINLRLDGIGLGHAPGPMVTQSMLGLAEVGFGFRDFTVDPEASTAHFVPSWDVTFIHAAGVFGRAGSSFSWDMIYGLGYRFVIAEGMGFEIYYGWLMPKDVEVLEFYQVEPGAIGVNLWGTF